MPQYALLVGQRQVRIQQVKVDARTAGLLEHLIQLIHGGNYWVFPVGRKTFRVQPG